MVEAKAEAIRAAQNAEAAETADKELPKKMKA
jgi:hypothetical protein